MKTNNNHTEYTHLSHLEKDVLLAFHTISPAKEPVNSWYTSRKSNLVKRPVRSHFQIPLFGATFATLCAFVMIWSVQHSHTSDTLAVNTSPESASLTETTSEPTLFAAKANQIADVPTRTLSTKSIPVDQNPLLAQIDNSINASSRVESESFAESIPENTLSTLFE
jgi:hypothetical protein